jgi:uncharacterized protein involved in exopolysaccharide biosynthesis
MDGNITLSDIKGVIRRRWWLPVLTTMIGAPIAVIVAVSLPPVYASTARILVESQVIPEELARSTISQSAGERIQFIQQRLMTRQNLLDIASANGVVRPGQNLSPSDVVSLMTRSTSIRGTTSSDRRSREVTGLDITFRSDRPATAVRVANDLVSRILTQNSQARTDRAANTLAFFEQEVRRLELEIANRAAEIETFKSENQMSLPESLASRQGEVISLRERAFGLANQRALLTEQRRRLEQAVISGQTRIGGQLSAQAQQLEQLRNTLVSQRATLADSHPSIRVLQARIAALEADVESGAIAADAQAGGAAAAPQRAELAAQVEALDKQIELIDQQTAANEMRIAELEASIGRTPSVQIRLEALQRSYNSLDAQLRDAVLKQRQAQLGERLEASQQSERFEVVEQAVAPERPISPNRPAIVAAGFVGSAGVGVALMILAELLNRSIRSAAHLERRLEIRPIATIPYVSNAAEKSRRRWLRRGFVIFAVVAPLCVLGAAHTLVMPLPDLGQRLLDATGVAPVIESIFLRLGI